MSRHIVGVTLDNLEHLPKKCRHCVFWELAPHLREEAEQFGQTDFEKEAWVSSVLLEWGSCGRIVYLDSVPAGYALYAPPSAVPRAVAFPTGPVSADAVLLTALRILPEFAGAGLGRVLVQAVAKDLTRRGVKAIEAFGDAIRRRPDSTLCRPGRFPALGRLQDRPPHPQVAPAAAGAALGAVLEGRRGSGAGAAVRHGHASPESAAPALGHAQRSVVPRTGD